ncbi:AzlC family ABC transporter permease [Paludicola sp. MB14-C6]|uniref:AzlC family ABC transporter permease n=1 Tax=Paludihabitans sp. MB14-C6 TaxID=3070656 RepID=UPI0027DBF3E6|nr:AzlC family ABC transporter permease [Paludicola sp. MB14-C6]WMJ22143.1 AzlC family ABC transporter permease [Paludicola sp. MB14-C6]
MKNKKLTFQKGLKDGLPICLGYLPISFAFGMEAVQNGLHWWIPLMISMTNLTSAGQFAGLSLILSGGAYIEIAVTTFIINIRYMLMSLSLSQKVEDKMTTTERGLISFGITDEVFAIASQQFGTLNTSYMLGLIATPYLGWAIGTLLGATATNLLPLAVKTALGIAIYGMFIAIIVPPAKKAKPVLITCMIAVCISCLFKWVPFLNQVSVGWVIIIAALFAAGYCAYRYPIDEDKQEVTE